MRKSVSLALLALLALMGILGCKKQGGEGANANEVVIGEYASLTGTTSAFGQSEHEGAMLALAQVNEKGILGGKKIRVVTEDDQSKQDEAIAAVEKMISRDNVCAVVGEVSSTKSLAGGGKCQEHQIPMLSPASTNPKVTQIGDYIFRICFTDDFQGKIDARFAGEKGWKRVAVLTDTASDYSKGLTKAFCDNFDASGLVKLEFKEGDRDFNSQLLKIKAANVDAIYIPAYYTEVTLIMQQARGLGLAMPCFGGDGWDSPDTLKSDDCQGCFYSNHYSAWDPRPKTQAFVAAYTKMYGRAPDAMAALGYDAMLVMADAINRAGSTDPKAIRDALAATKNFEGGTGTITIDADRNASKPIVILQITDHQAKLVKTYEN